MHTNSTRYEQISHTDACTCQTQSNTVHYTAFCTAFILNYGYCHFDLTFLVGVGNYDSLEWFTDALGELGVLFVEFNFTFLDWAEWCHWIVDF